MIGMPSETDGSFLLLPQVILQMSLSQKLTCLIQGVQSSTVTAIRVIRTGNPAGLHLPERRRLPAYRDPKIVRIPHYRPKPRAENPARPNTGKLGNVRLSANISIRNSYFVDGTNLIEAIVVAGAD
jgi:hypothetical protein